MRLFWENCKRVYHVYRDYMLITYKIHVHMKYTCIVKVRL